MSRRSTNAACRKSSRRRTISTPPTPCCADTAAFGSTTRPTPFLAATSEVQRARGNAQADEHSHGTGPCAVAFAPCGAAARHDAGAAAEQRPDAVELNPLLAGKRYLRRVPPR